MILRQIKNSPENPKPEKNSSEKTTSSLINQLRLQGQKILKFHSQTAPRVAVFGTSQSHRFEKTCATNQKAAFSFGMRIALVGPGVFLCRLLS